jgi:hypothetical protein
MFTGRSGSGQDRFGPLEVRRVRFLQVLPLFYLEGAWLTMEFPSAGSARSGPDFSDSPLIIMLHYFDRRQLEADTAVRAMHRQRSKCSPTGPALGSGPIGGCAVVIVNAFLVGAIAPRRRLGSGVGGGTLELLPGQSNDIAALAGVIFEGVPRQRVVVLPDAEKAAE